MKIITKLIPIVAILMAGCQKTTTSNTSDFNMKTSSLNCRSGEGGVSVAQAGIEGLDVLKSGQLSGLSLGSDVDCEEAQKASWEIGSKVLGAGGQIATQINGTGFYYVTVTTAGATGGGLQGKVSNSSSVSAKVAVTNSSVLVVGPQAGTEGETYQFSLAVPEGTQLAQASWNFGDETPVVTSLNPVSHSFGGGVYEIAVQITDSNGEIKTLNHIISILPVLEGPTCPLDQMEIVGPTEVPLARPIDYSLNLSACLRNLIRGVSWDFGDGTAPVNTTNARHSFQTPGTYTIEVTVIVGTNPDAPSITLTRTVKVLENMEEMPGPIDDTPADPLRCTEQGATRSSESGITTRSVACGLEGTRANSYKNVIIETCDLVGERMRWHETSRSEVLVNEGACEGQSCELITSNGKEILKDNESRILYTTQNPAAACSTVQETRTCRNGVLSGSQSAQYSTCNSGCGEFGTHGTTRIGVITGEISLPKTCQFGEEGVIDTFNQISDQRCEDGQIRTSNSRQGEIKLAGSCPTYSYSGTEQWSACSADCGGQQTRTFECRDNKGAVVSNERCSGAAPVESRLCDANPEAVKRTEVSTTKEDAPASGACPKNQIGVIISERDVTVTKTFACVNHSVQLADTTTTYGPWVTERFCRDFTPARCSHDSLSTTAAKGRYEWMVKCQDQIPVIKEFLTNFADVKYQKMQVDEGSRRLYPTFMNADSKKAWIAPKVASASCAAPENIYVAALCVASCSTPEQQIMVEVQNERKFKYMPFVEALNQNVPVVATLHSASSMSSKTVAKSRVDNWVTELVDTEHQLLSFKMKSGGQLKLTLNHPILSQNGVMKLASDFKAGESLVQLGGKLDEILSIEQVPYYGKVYNLFVKSNDLKKNVVVTNGYLNGTAFYQNEGAKFLNRALFREQLFRGAFENKGK